MNVSHCLSSPGPGHDSSVGEWINLTDCPLQAQVMIAQWENECISLSVLPVAWVRIVQWENECISLSVLSVARVMIAQREIECISLSVLTVARVQFPTVVEYFRANVAEDGWISPQWHHSPCGHWGGRPKSNHGQTVAEKMSHLPIWFEALSFQYTLWTPPPCILIRWMWMYEFSAGISWTDWTSMGITIENNRRRYHMRHKRYETWWYFHDLPGGVVAGWWDSCFSHQLRLSTEHYKLVNIVVRLAFCFELGLNWRAHTLAMTKVWTQVLTVARPVLYHWAIPLSHNTLPLSYPTIP